MGKFLYLNAKKVLKLDHSIDVKNKQILTNIMEQKIFRLQRISPYQYQNPNENNSVM